MSFRKSSLLAVLTALALVVVALTAAANHVADNSLTVQSAIDAGNSNPPANPGKTHDQHGPFNHPQEGETPDISLSEETLDFGEASIVESVRLFLMISNIGDADLVVSDISTEAPFYPAFNGEFTVAPEEVHELVVTFTPEVVGEYEGVLMIVSNDPVEEETSISLLGTGVLPQDGLHYHWRLTDTNASILIRGASLLAEALPAGDEIAVFTPGGVCAGAGVWNGNQIGIAAFGDEDDTEIIEGFHSEERMSFRIWDWEAETEYRAIPHYIQGDGLFRVNGFTAIERLEGVNFYHWAAPERTDNNHSLLVEDATLDNEPLNIGDEIGLFTPTGMLAGWAVWPEQDRIGFPAWGDEAETEDVIEGFRENEEFSFKVWDRHADAEWYAEPIWTHGPQVYNAGGFSVLLLEAHRYRDLEVSFQRNWNMISINISPPDEWYDENEPRGPSVIRMMSDLVERGLLILIKNEEGNFYAPEYGYNGIAYWDLTRGYQVKLVEAAPTTWTGYPIHADADIPLRRGWNLIAYYPTYVLRCDHPYYLPFSGILDYVEIAKDVDGNFAAPAFNYSGMAPWYETQGYQIKVTQDVVLNYPPNPEEGRLAVVEPLESELTPMPTPFNMSVLLIGLECGAFENPRIQALSASGVPAGEGSLDEHGRCGLAVWGDDPSTAECEGLREGEGFSLWLNADRMGRTVRIEISKILKGEGLVYKTNAFTAAEAAIQKALPAECYLAESYPNPFNPATRLTFGLPDDGLVKVSVYDMNGRFVAVVDEGCRTAGVHSVLWDASAQPTGVYLARLEWKGLTITRKLLLVR